MILRRKSVHSCNCPCHQHCSTKCTGRLRSYDSSYKLMDIMEAILKEDETTEQAECNAMQSVDTDINRPAEESGVTDVNTKAKQKTRKEDTSTAKSKKPDTKLKVKKTRSLRQPSYDPTGLEDSPAQVVERFKRGCECIDDQCFKDLNPEVVYRHRLNIAELTKAEHDMYLMGVTMACLTDPYQTARHTERRRLRAQYVYQGRRVCLDAFLYLENCTHYQIKRIRKHLMTHGVTPRVHGNYGKIPHNTFSLDIYKIATEFLKNFIEGQEAKQKTKLSKNAPLHLPPDITRKTMHDMYTEHCKIVSPDVKTMGYSTFRRFMKVQFPQVKFAKLEFVVRNQTAQNHCQTEPESTTTTTTSTSTSTQSEGQQQPPKADLVAAESAGTILPLVLTNDGQNDTYLLTPIRKLREVVSYQVTKDGLVLNRTIAVSKTNTV